MLRGVILKDGKNTEDALDEHQGEQSIKPVRETLAWISLIISLLLSVAVLWSIFQNINYRNASNQRLQQLEEYSSTTNIDVESNNDYVTQLIEPRFKKFDGDLRTLKKSQSKIGEDLIALSHLIESNKFLLSKLPKSDQYILDVSEAAYLLRAANQRLQITKDIDSAIVIAVSVDKLLQKLNRTELDVVRQVLAKDLTQLRSLAIVDTAGLLFRLSALILQIESIEVLEPPSLKESEAVQERDIPEKNNLRFTFTEALKKLSDFIVIRKNEKSYQALLDPQFIIILKKNISMLMKHAQLAILTKDPALYEHSLEQADVLLREIPVSEEVFLVQLKREIKALQKISIINKPLNLLDSIRELEKVIDRDVIDNRDPEK